MYLLCLNWEKEIKNWKNHKLLGFFSWFKPSQPWSEGLDWCKIAWGQFRIRLKPNCSWAIWPRHVCLCDKFGVNNQFKINDPKMYVLYPAIYIKVGCPPWAKMSSLSPNMLRLLHLTRFDPLRLWAPCVSDNEKKNRWNWHFVIGHMFPKFKCINWSVILISITRTTVTIERNVKRYFQM